MQAAVQEDDPSYHFIWLKGCATEETLQSRRPCPFLRARQLNSKHRCQLRPILTAATNRNTNTFYISDRITIVAADSLKPTGLRTRRTSGHTAVEQAWAKRVESSPTDRAFPKEVSKQQGITGFIL